MHTSNLSCGFIAETCQMANFVGQCTVGSVTVVAQGPVFEVLAGDSNSVKKTGGQRNHSFESLRSALTLSFIKGHQKKWDRQSYRGNVGLHLLGCYLWLDRTTQQRGSRAWKQAGLEAPRPCDFTQPTSNCVRLSSSREREPSHLQESLEYEKWMEWQLLGIFFEKIYFS